MKGNLADISLAELLKMIIKYNGRLGIWNFQKKKQYECFLQNGKVVYININGKNITEIETVNYFLSELAADKESYYAFQKDALLELPPQIQLSIDKILSTTILTDTNNIAENDLPNILTKFESVKGFSANLPNDLESFWNLSAVHLHRGCSISDLGDIFEMNLADIQVYFYKLRTIGAIKPVRLFKVNLASAKAKTAALNLQKIANLQNRRNNVLGTPTEPSNFSVRAQEYNESQAHNKIISDPPAAINYSNLVDKSEVSTSDIKVNEFFVKLPDSQNTVETTANSYHQKTIEENSRANTVNQVPQKQVFDLSSVQEKKGVFRRMLSSLFSRRAQ